LSSVVVVSSQWNCFCFLNAFFFLLTYSKDSMSRPAYAMQVLCKGRIWDKWRALEFVVAESQRCISLGIVGFIHVNTETKRFECQVGGGADLLRKLDLKSRCSIDHLFSAATLGSVVFKPQFVGSVSAGGQTRVIVQKRYDGSGEEHRLFFHSERNENLLGTPG
jgi:hypothetical protein